QGNRVQVSLLQSVSYFLTRERHRLIRDLHDLQIEEDLQRQYQYVLPYLNELRDYQLNSACSEYEDFHDSQKEICLVTLKYQNSNAQQRHADESNITYIDEIISCCEHRLIHRNRHNHLFHIQDIFGSKPCYKRELDNNTVSNLIEFRIVKFFDFI
ncbi:unnamed protein product, partial [Rotaria socialis]